MKQIMGEIKLPGDKSISHRSALFSAFMPHRSVFTNFNFNEDCTATLSCLREMGINWDFDGASLSISGKIIPDWTKPESVLDARNSGTTARLISGILSSLPFRSRLIGDASLSKRPMGRILVPLRQMGADIKAENERLPLEFSPAERLQGIRYRLPVASAQVKSAILLSGLFAEGLTEVIETTETRDHTERMLKLKSVINSDGSRSVFSSSEAEYPDLSMEIPGDFSSAAFYICAALMAARGDLSILNVSLNPTRTGLITVLEKMGAKISKEVIREQPEPIGRIHVTNQKLHNIEITPELIPNIIDEIPILSILASQSHGEFILRGAGELRYKESDRIKAIVMNLRELGVEVTEFQDGFAITGPQKIRGGKITTYNDHRIAMAFTIAGLVADGNVEIDNPSCASVSFPDFYKILVSINS